MGTAPSAAEAADPDDEVEVAAADDPTDEVEVASVDDTADEVEVAGGPADAELPPPGGTWTPVLTGSTPRAAAPGSGL